jgi:hypothetical protein
MHVHPGWYDPLVVLVRLAWQEQQALGSSIELISPAQFAEIRPKLVAHGFLSAMPLCRKACLSYYI